MTHPATPDDLVLVRRDSGGVFPDGTTNHAPIDFSDTASPAAPRPEGLDVEVVAYQLWDALGGNIIDQYEADLYSVIGVDANGVPHRLVARLSDTATPDAG